MMFLLNNIMCVQVSTRTPTAILTLKIVIQDKHAIAKSMIVQQTKKHVTFIKKKRESWDELLGMKIHLRKVRVWGGDGSSLVEF